MTKFSSRTTLFGVLITVLAVNQIALVSVSHAMGTGLLHMQWMNNVLGIKQASAMEIMMPILNEDGVTTHLQMMPTITEVLGETGSSDVVADAMMVMIAKGKPFYAPDGIDFDDAVGALEKWGSYESLELTDEQMERYNRLIGTFTCNFCCGDATSVTRNGRCGCAHAKGARGFFKYMIQNYGDTYSDDQLFGEAYRWQAIWYPSGVVEDYLLATGRSSVLGHNSHGGAGEDGMHGVK
jgi:hypothetical protein